MIVFALVALFASCLFAESTHQAVSLRHVDTLTFQAGVNTVPGRTKSLPQLVCVSGNACGTAKQPQFVSCKNIGLNYATGDPNWACTARLDGVRFGRTDVSCEGYAHKDDTNILAGSCNLEYTLEYIPSQQQQRSNAIFLDYLFGFGILIILIAIFVYIEFKAPLTPTRRVHTPIPVATAVPVQSFFVPTPRKEYPVQATSYGTTIRREEQDYRPNKGGASRRNEPQVNLDINQPDHVFTATSYPYQDTLNVPTTSSTGTTTRRREEPSDRDTLDAPTTFSTGTTTRRREEDAPLPDRRNSVTPESGSVFSFSSPGEGVSFGTTRRRG